MTTYYAQGHPTAVLADDDLRLAMRQVCRQLGPRTRVLAVPPDYTRADSRAGILTGAVYDFFGSRLVDLLPALGTHKPMSAEQRTRMFPGVPHELFRDHDWQCDVETIGWVTGEFVAQATQGVYARPWPAQVNRLISRGAHDLILSLGQVVPHEVIGMASHNKNIFIGTGGAQGIHESHFLSAIYGMERIMGRHDTPLRRILNQAESEFCRQMPLLYALTVVDTDASGHLVTRGLFVGDDTDCFQRASELALAVNVKWFDERMSKVVCYLDPDEFHSTWVGNKAIYRTRMVLADAAELVVLAPGVRQFGERPAIDQLIRQFGYRPRATILQQVEQHSELQENLSAAAHLIHGSPEGRFRVTYCTGGLSAGEIESVGFDSADLNAMLDRYYVAGRPDGWYTTSDGEPFYFINKPALGLWVAREAW